jgi:hypothetical protein
MIEPAKLDLGADRWTLFSTTLAFLGVDFTGAVFAAQIRLTPDAAGPPLVDLATVVLANAQGVRLAYAGTDTVANHIAAGRLAEVPDGMLAGDNLELSQVVLRVNEATMEGLPLPPARGDDFELAWDLHVTVGGEKRKWIGGRFVVRAGVTQ